MTFQLVRGAMQKLTSDALVAGGLPFEQHCFDNAQETPPSGTYAVINLSFPQVVLEAIGCEGTEAVIGGCTVLLYSPRGQGMKPAEDALTHVLKAWIGSNKAMVNQGGVHLRTRNIDGPNGLAPDERPYQVTALSCTFTARVD
jgi:hypothetical protein